MTSDEARSNLLIGVICFTIIMLLMQILPILFLLLTLLLGLSVWRNWFEIGKRLQRLPGISDTGGLKSGALMCLYFGMFVTVPVVGLDSTLGTSENPPSSSAVEANGDNPNNLVSDAADQSTTEITSDIPSYVPAEAKDLSYADTERIRVSVKLTESRPDLTEEEALLIGKDVVQSRKNADEIAVHIFQPEGEVGAGACATVEWTKEMGYETGINRLFCEDPEW